MTILPLRWRSWGPATLLICTSLAMLALAHCSSDDSNGGADAGPDATGPVDGDIADVAKDASRRDVEDVEEAGPIGDGGALEGASTCSAPLGTCGNKGGACCNGLSCVNDAFCCVSAVGLVTGNCTFPEDCCSGH